MKVLYCGDPHARPDSLDEMEKLVAYLRELAETTEPEAIVFLGDQFHTHSVIHLSVLSFWKRAFKTLSEVTRVYALVGNHDMSGRAGDTDNSMMLYDPNIVTVVNQPMLAPWKAALIPYQHDAKEFEAKCFDFRDVPVVVCHQTFDGSRFENGFYAKDGVNPNLIPQEFVISGHIHAPQKLGKVWYPGSPRWQTVSDANTERHVWLVIHDESGKVVGAEGYKTDHVCKPIYTLVDRESAPAVLPTIPATVIVDVFGSEKYVRERALELQEQGARVRQFPEVVKELKVKESEGLVVSFSKFIGQHNPKFGTSADRLMEMAQERISWLHT